ncbi:RING-H2 finger protein ATL43 [Solanum verrucosum]|uniref:RING-H2 finger protein ATL43 n=1 Tax=Solanum verrucosum TaxID=315347 RepID=UPI0020D02CE7|nr:RING-H2 finger protein ATL43 [Solanum verrucosum]
MGICNVHFLSPSLWLFFFVMITVIINSSYADENAQSPSPPDLPPYYRSRGSPFRPSIAIVVAILTTIFSIVFMLLLYAKHCKREGTFGTTSGGLTNNLHSSSFRKNSGIDRTVIESLPVFRFGSLRGQKAEGLECAVCLNKFESSEILRLLPKCKHAFHIECVDTWLDAHSTCPLCRYQVDPEDILLISHENERKSTSSSICSSSPAKEKEKEKQRIHYSSSGRHSSAGERGTSSSSLQIIVESPKQETPSFLNKRMSLDSWNFYRKKSKSTNSTSLSRKDGMLLNKKKAPEAEVEAVEERRLEHRIIISGDEPELGTGSGSRHRWSDVEGCDRLYLRSEMILSESRRYSGSRKRTAEMGSGRRVINERSVSELTGMSRFRSNNEEERERKGAVKRWLDWISQSQNKSVSLSDSGAGAGAAASSSAT